jgi:hypothetical protein
MPPSVHWYRHFDPCGTDDYPTVYDVGAGAGSQVHGTYTSGDSSWISADAAPDCGMSDPGSGRIPPDTSRPGGPLRVRKETSGEITIDWGESWCSCADNDYEVYRGTLASLFGGTYDHGWMSCSTAGALTYTYNPGSSLQSRYFVVVPTNGTDEGSYGLDSDDNERPLATSPCRGQFVKGFCP